MKQNISAFQITAATNTWSKSLLTLRIFAYEQLITESQFSICVVNES